ncbi:MAG TPA: response regulator [Ktedonobacterales bacterium]|nr:response regulator [Ktedonobacterales bacterium]
MAQVPTVLIVDDEPGIRKMLVEMLSLEGYPTETANNGQEALDLLARGGPRVVLLDLLMPVVNGRGVVEYLDAQPGERARHKIVLMSAIETLTANRDLQADGRLSKPFTLDQLLNTIAAVTASVQA